MTTINDQPGPAVVLLSGGLDSTTVLALATRAGYRCCCLSFAYGQRHTRELELARANAARWGAAEHLVLRLELDAIGGSALTAAGLAVPKDRQLAEAEPAGEIPITYVPGRNTIFLAYAAAWAEVLGARDIFIGVNAVDFSGYPDCRPDYLAALTAALNLGSKAGREGRPFRLQAPLLHLSKAEIIAQGRELGVDYSQTHSCYDPDSRHRPCGRCDACILRLRGFAAAGCPDPLSYQTRG
ncbi:7-cyano-7-deazaguanine synthase QueC [Desulfurivibrio sp. C05AmB]|jgi:7-cyano-7-deazaguanine synthase|uniref:7-cyano-7-deazaguanine synthase QueC n=1 Tax=Desulfurivibrio sp. C05AmB TaxID=3374371 RepID=UPI00376F2A89